MTDDGARAAARASASPGHGIVGMRERAALHGGSVEAGPAADGGFVVRARIPMVAGARHERAHAGGSTSAWSTRSWRRR